MSNEQESRSANAADRTGDSHIVDLAEEARHWLESVGQNFLKHGILCKVINQATLNLICYNEI